MSSPPNGRALALPVGWGSTRESGLSLPVVEVRSPSDEELMCSLQAKDSKALELLFDRYSGLVFGIALRILNDHSEAEEVVQEAFFYVYQRALIFDPLDDTLLGRNDLEREIEARLDFSQLQCAFEDLTHMQRQTLEMFYFEGMELREISERPPEPLGK